MSTRLLYTGAMTQQQQALCIVDMQNAFFRDPGLQSRRAEVVTAANQLADAARAVAIPVFVISTVHSRDTSTWTLNMLEAGEGFLFQGDHGTEIVPELNIESTTMVEKTRDSAFFGTDFHLRLTNLGITRLVFSGVSTHGCIAQTVRDAYANNIRSTIVTDAVADTRADAHRVQLEMLDNDGQATLSTVAEVTAQWEATA